jgi:hypothetical protein
MAKWKIGKIDFIDPLEVSIPYCRIKRSASY